MSFESVLADLETFGNLNSKYQEILRKYRNILPELLVKEGNIDI